MSNTDKTDKTGDKLVASIRKTRAGATKKTTARKAEKAGTGGAATGARPAPRASTRTAARAEKKTVQVPETPDSYQYGRRVWPD